MPAVQGLLLAATVAFVSGSAEHRSAEGPPRAADTGTALAAGHQLRTGDDGLVRAEIPGMVLTLAAASSLRLEGTPLRPVLESGRLEIASEGETVDVATGEAEVRGGGRLVVRRAGTRTQLMALRGGFRVRAAGGAEEIALAVGEGLALAAGAAGERPRALAPAPEVVAPGVDPQYVRADQPVSLTWAPASAVHFQVLPFDSPEPIVARDQDQAPAHITLKVPGLYRWRASARGPDGSESLPSTEGLICVVEGP
ncbi:MAG TPA: hypothetical protein VF310_13670 [Vicinamibacteria bacterium]